MNEPTCFIFIKVTEENGTCYYTVDEAGQECAIMSQIDYNGDSIFSDGETYTFDGIVDCYGQCRHKSIQGYSMDSFCDEDLNCPGLNNDNGACD